MYKGHVNSDVPTSKTCVRCKTERSVDKFEKTRNVCRACRYARHLNRISDSPEAYLNRLMSRTVNQRGKKFIVEITLDHLLALWEKQQGRCALSGVHMTYHADRGQKKEFNVSIDRIRSHEGYVSGNVQLVAQRVNTIKNDLDEATLNWWIRTMNSHACAKSDFDVKG